MSVGEVAATAAVMFLGLLLLGIRADVALLLAGIAPATAPAATIDVVHEARADGPFTRTLLGIVAVDDAWGLIVFSLALGIGQTLNGHGGMLEALGWGLHEFGGALLIGAALGVPMAYLTGRIQPGEPPLVEALGAVFLCGGVAIWLDVSYLLAAMVMGAIVANLARPHTRPFHAIERIEWPFMILFFILAGASLRVSSLNDLGLIGIAYVLLRVFGRISGAWLGGVGCGAEPRYRRMDGVGVDAASRRRARHGPRRVAAVPRADLRHSSRRNRGDSPVRDLGPDPDSLGARADAGSRSGPLDGLTRDPFSYSFTRHASSRAGRTAPEAAAARGLGWSAC